MACEGAPDNEGGNDDAGRIERTRQTKTKSVAPYTPVLAAMLLNRVLELCGCKAAYPRFGDEVVEEEPIEPPLGSEASLLGREVYRVDEEAILTALTAFGSVKGQDEDRIRVRMVRMPRRRLYGCQDGRIERPCWCSPTAFKV